MRKLKHVKLIYGFRLKISDTFWSFLNL
jgi:hypothetical protein